jgi:hypothetical protein
LRISIAVDFSRLKTIKIETVGFSPIPDSNAAKAGIVFISFFIQLAKANCNYFYANCAFQLQSTLVD